MGVVMSWEPWKSIEPFDLDTTEVVMKTVDESPKGSTEEKQDADEIDKSPSVVSSVQ